MSETEVDTGAPQEFKKYQSYACAVDPDDNDKATEIKLCNFSRPHMRAFHCSWFAFFTAFFIWFAIAPLLSEIQITLNLTKKEIWTSNIVGVAGTIIVRFILGPLCDKYGARALFCLVLMVASIPTACTGLVNSSTGLIVLRFFIGIAGGSFVMCQYWTSSMFHKSVVGAANAIAGGWGNLGGGVTQLVMGSVLFPMFKAIYGNGPDAAEMAWRTVCIVPAVFAFGLAIITYYISEDAPKGNYTELKKHGLMPEVSAAASFRSGAVNINSWILFIQYACCFGVELTMYAASAIYYKEVFALSTEKAAAYASIFGWMNLVSRGSGGWISDKLNQRMGMRGRLLVQTVILVFEGGLVFAFAHTKSLGAAIAVMAILSYFVQACCGTTYAIVPYVDPSATGSISGIVGAGGNVGAVLFGLGFRQLDYLPAFSLMAGVILLSAVLGAFIFIKGHRGLLCGEDSPQNKALTLAVPEPDEEVKASINKDVKVEKDVTDDDNQSVESEHHC